MANASILAAFERMWQHINNTYCTKTEINSKIPTVTEEDNGKFLRVIDGAWAASSVPNAEEATF